MRCYLADSRSHSKKVLVLVHEGRYCPLRGRDKVKKSSVEAIRRGESFLYVTREEAREFYKNFRPISLKSCIVKES